MVAFKVSQIVLILNALMYLKRTVTSVKHLIKELYHEGFIACSPKVLEQVMFKRILNGNIHGRLYGLMMFL